jgi:hypothetical protein
MTHSRLATATDMDDGVSTPAIETSRRSDPENRWPLNPNAAQQYSQAHNEGQTVRSDIDFHG